MKILILILLVAAVLVQLIALRRLNKSLDQYIKSANRLLEIEERAKERIDTIH